MGRRDEVTSRSLTVKSRAERPRTVGARMHHDGVTDDQPEPCDVRLFDRLVSAGLSIERIEQHLAAGRVYVDGVRVTDPYQPAAPAGGDHARAGLSSPPAPEAGSSSTATTEGRPRRARP
jgi:hypothetical protein